MAELWSDGSRERREEEECWWVETVVCDGGLQQSMLVIWDLVWCVDEGKRWFSMEKKNKENKKKKGEENDITRKEKKKIK